MVQISDCLKLFKDDKDNKEILTQTTIFVQGFMRGD
jgi:ribosomal protein S4E